MIELRTSSPGEIFLRLFAIVERISTEIIVPLAAIRGDPECTGGWFTLWRHQPDKFGCSISIVGIAIGHCDAQHYLRCMFFANEKAHRLGELRGDVSSWQSRDERDFDAMKRKYGGAIRIKRQFIFSFSGFSEHEDEMICVLAARELGIINDDEVEQIIAISNNIPLRTHVASMRTLATW